MTAARDALLAEIARHGPRPFSRLVDLALYGDAGFFATGGGAGRRRDFITSVEVGPLFGAVIARALDRWWIELGEPDPFVVVDAGAGVGTLARTVLLAEPRCAPALRYLLVERSPTLREAHAEGLTLSPPALSFATAADPDDQAPPPPPGPIVCSLPALPAGPLTGVVIANELLDNLPFGILERVADGWAEVRVGSVDGSTLTEVTLPAPEEAAGVARRGAPDAPLGARIPWQHEAAAWLRSALQVIGTGRVVVLDYADTTSNMANRPRHSWLRTYREHRRAGAPLTDLGRQDITCEVALDQLVAVRPPDVDRNQRDFLLDHGIDELVDEGRRAWSAAASAPDLAAVRMRSRVSEAEALLDVDGLGGFRVLEWRCGPPPPGVTS